MPNEDTIYLLFHVFLPRATIDVKLFLQKVVVVALLIGSTSETSISIVTWFLV